LTEIGSGGSGRADLWTVGWRMTADHPGLGVGVANFKLRAREYTREPGELTHVNYISEVARQVHNLYLQLTTETGLPGLLLFLAFVGACLRCTWRAAQRFRSSGQHRMDTCARLVLIAQVSMLAADVFLSAIVDKRLWIILALGPILANIAAREAVPLTSTAAR
jgi:putative inorganic carbon (HCO3(-)) transporter